MAGRSQEFFHGTTHDIPVGGHVLPAEKTGLYGTPGFPDQPSHQHAFATDEEGEAWYWADVSHEFNEHHTDQYHPRTRVYAVEPHPEMQKGKFHPDNFKDMDPRDSFEETETAVPEYIAPSYKVKHSIDVMPGRQGTLPINWNQFAAPSRQYGEFNHPDDSEVARSQGWDK